MARMRAIIAFLFCWLLAVATCTPVLLPRVNDASRKGKEVAEPPKGTSGKPMQLMAKNGNQLPIWTAYENVLGEIITIDSLEAKARQWYDWVKADARAPTSDHTLMVVAFYDSHSEQIFASTILRGAFLDQVNMEGSTMAPKWSSVRVKTNKGERGHAEDGALILREIDKEYPVPKPNYGDRHGKPVPGGSMMGIWGVWQSETDIKQHPGSVLVPCRDCREQLEKLGVWFRKSRPVNTDPQFKPGAGAAKSGAAAGSTSNQAGAAQGTKAGAERPAGRPVAGGGTSGASVASANTATGAGQGLRPGTVGTAARPATVASGSGTTVGRPGAGGSASTKTGAVQGVQPGAVQPANRPATAVGSDTTTGSVNNPPVAARPPAGRVASAPAGSGGTSRPAGGSSVIAGSPGRGSNRGASPPSPQGQQNRGPVPPSNQEHPDAVYWGAGPANLQPPPSNQQHPDAVNWGGGPPSDKSSPPRRPNRLPPPLTSSELGMDDMSIASPSRAGQSPSRDGSDHKMKSSPDRSQSNASASPPGGSRRIGSPADSQSPRTNSPVDPMAPPSNQNHPDLEAWRARVAAEGAAQRGGPGQQRTPSPPDAAPEDAVDYRQRTPLTRPQRPDSMQQTTPPARLPVRPKTPGRRPKGSDSSDRSASPKL